jgi:ABC-2 type transport system permease protein
VTASITRQLALKDFYIARWTLVGSLVAGLASIAVTPLSPAAFYVGAVCFVCVLVVLTIFMVMTGVMQEKKENVLAFLLSLPVSTTEYWWIKIAVNVAMYAGSWLILTVAALLTIHLSDIPNGLIPFTLAIAAYAFSYYSVLLAVAVATESLAWTTTVIVIGNISVNFIIPFVFRLPSGRTAQGNEAIWGADILITLAVEAAICIAAPAIALLVQGRRRDFI